MNTPLQYSEVYKVNPDKVFFKVKKYLFRQPAYVVSFVVLVIFSGEVLASEWSVKPRIGLRNQYDTNRSLTTEPHDSVTGVSVIPSIDFNRETDLTSNRITARVISTRYSDSDIRDSELQTVGFRHRTRGLRNTFNILANYRRDDTFATLGDIEVDDDDSDTGDSSDGDEGLTKTRVKRSNLTIDPKWAYRMSESYSLELSYRYRKRDYSGETGTDLVEFNANAYALSLDKAIDQKNSISYVLRLSEFDPADNTKTTDTSIGLTYRHNFTQLSDIRLVAGLRDTDSPDGNTDGSVYRITYNTRGETSKFLVDLSRDLSGSGGGSVVERIQLDVRYRQRLTDLTNLYIRARAFDNDAIDNSTSANRTYLFFEPKLRFALSRNFGVDFAYRYRKEKFANNDQSADSHAVFLGIDYTFDKWATRQ